MDATRRSGLKEYSLGIITENKPYGTDIAKIVPIEEFSMEKGDLVEDTRDMTSSLPDINDVVKTATIKGSAILKAKWIPYGNSNRDTAPDVRKNETVMIYRFADTQEYYWDTIFREPTLRRLEHVRYAYSNKPSGVDAFTSDSSYWLEFSTAEKRIKLHTSDNDGEACTYDLTIDTAAGTVELIDNLGNSIYLDSPGGKLEMVTNTSIAFKTLTFHVDAPDIRLDGTTYIKEIKTELPTWTPTIISATTPVPGYGFKNG